MSQMKLQPADAHIEKVILDTVRAHLEGRELDSCKIEIETDEEGGQWINVDVKFKLAPIPIDAKKSMKMRLAVQDALNAANEFRTLILDHHFADGQKIKGFERASRAA